jgi:large repetitive protein
MKVLALALLLPIAAAAEPPGAGCGAVRFERAGSWALPAEASPLVRSAADFDGDGRDDLIVRVPGSGGAGLYQLWASREDGPFEVTGLPVLEGESIGPFGDLAGDSALDILVRSPAGWKVLRNDGDGRFVAGPPTGSSTGHAALVDLDGDGRLDLVWTAYRDPGQPRRVRLSVALANGLGGFGAPTETVWDAPFDLEAEAAPRVGDFDGDGLADVLVPVTQYFPSYGHVELFRGDGRGGLTNAGPLARFVEVSMLETVDLNRDGVPEVVSGSYRGGTVRVLSRAESGFRATSFIRAGARLLEFFAADVNGDGWGDLAVRDQEGRVQVYLSTPAGDHLRTGEELPVPGPIGFGDLEGTGRAGLVAVEGEAGTKRLVFFRSVCDEGESTLVLPVAVRTVGATGARFDTELTLLNTGVVEARVEIRDGASWAGEPVRTVVLGAAQVVTLSTAGRAKSSCPWRAPPGRSA